MGKDGLRMTDAIEGTLMPSPHTVSAEQVAAFADRVGPNNRPLQSPWAREVLEERAPSLASVR